MLVDCFLAGCYGWGGAFRGLLGAAYDMARNASSDEISLFSKFKDHILQEEKSLEVILEKIKYYIDAPNAIQLLLGSAPLEEVS